MAWIVWETANVKITTDVRPWTDDGQTMDTQGTDSLLLTHRCQNALLKAKGLTVDAPTYMYEETGPQQSECNFSKNNLTNSHPNSYPPSPIHAPYRLPVYSPVRPTWRVHHKYILIQMRCFGLCALPASVHLGGTPTNSMGYQHYRYLQLIQQEILNFKNPFTGLWFCNTKIWTHSMLRYIYIVYLEE